MTTAYMSSLGISTTNSPDLGSFCFDFRSVFPIKSSACDPSLCRCEFCVRFFQMGKHQYFVAASASARTSRSLGTDGPQPPTSYFRRHCQASPLSSDLRAHCRTSTASQNICQIERKKESEKLGQIKRQTIRPIESKKNKMPEATSERTPE